MWAAYSPTVTHVVAASNDERLERFIKLHPERDVHTVEWLMSGNAVLSSLSHSGPSQYWYLAPSKDGLRDSYGDYYFVESTVEDVTALLERHIARHVHQDIPSPSDLAQALCREMKGDVRLSDLGSGHVAGVQALRAAVQKVDQFHRTKGKQTVLSGRTLLEYFDGAAHKQSFAETGSFLHQCIIMLVNLENLPLMEADNLQSPDSLSSWVHTARAHHLRMNTVLSKCRMQRAAALARGMGARIFEPGVDDAVRVRQVTHIVGVGANGFDAGLRLYALLNAVRRGLEEEEQQSLQRTRGLASFMAALREEVQRGGIAVMSEEWLEATFDAVASTENTSDLVKLVGSHGLHDTSRLFPDSFENEKESDDDTGAGTLRKDMLSGSKPVEKQPQICHHHEAPSGPSGPSGPSTEGFNILSLLPSSGSDSERDTDTRIKTASPIVSPTKQVDSHHPRMNQVDRKVHAPGPKSKVPLRERLAALRKHQ